MKVIGITGGMASGKSTLAQMLRGPGVVHVDADKLVHRLMHEDRETIAAIAVAFPEAVKAPPPVREGRIDRAALAQQISKKPETLSVLEAILHPRVRAMEEAVILNAQHRRLRAVILDVPLLFETDADQLCDVVIVAHAPLKLRRQRAFRRLGMTEQKWQRLLERQLPDHARHARADIVISTAVGKAATRREVQKLKKEWGLK